MSKTTAEQRSKWQAAFSSHREGPRWICCLLLHDLAEAERRWGWGSSVLYYIPVGIYQEPIE